MTLRFEVCEGYEDYGITLPKRATKHSVGYDFFSPEDYKVRPKEKLFIPTHVKVKMPHNMWLGVFSRSSLYKKSLHHYLGCGVIDADYYGNEDNDGDIGVIVENTGDVPVFISRGERIAQGVFFPAILGDDVVEEERTSGFGSTGD